MSTYVNESFTPIQTEKITGAPASAVISLARDIAKNPEKTLFACGMGPNQFFNSDLKDRAIFFVAALTRNIGFVGGNVGSYAGNYKTALLGGEPTFALEDPFNLQTSESGKVNIKKYVKYDSIHYLNYGDRVLYAGKNLITGKTHIPTPTKLLWMNNSNSVIGNTKWHYDVVFNTLPKIEFIAFSDWWWTGFCEYSNLVFACDSWSEIKDPDMTESCINPFVQIYPETPLKRVFNTESDVKIIANVAKALGKLINDSRMEECSKFVYKDKIKVYLQRIIDNSANLTDYSFDTLHDKVKQGIPALANNRTYPRFSSFDQIQGDMPWYTKSGRLEFYRPELEFKDSGENIIVYRGPIDSTLDEPNVIVAKPHPAIKPKSPRDYGLNPSDLSVEVRQLRHVIVSPEALF